MRPGQSIPSRAPASRCERALLGAAILATFAAAALVLVYPQGWARAGREDGLVDKHLNKGGIRTKLGKDTLENEEISWGQRLFGIAPPEFFATHNVQGEINVHNLIPPPWDALLGAAVILGFCFSPLWRRQRWVRCLRRRGLPWPRPVHASVLAACLGAGLLVALTTGAGDVEELGELVFVLVVAATWCGSAGASPGSRSSGSPAG